MTGARMAHLTEAQVSELADGALAGAEHERAGHHMEQCERCRRDVAEARALLVMAREARDGVRAPPELWPLVAGATIHAARLRRQLLRSARGVLLVAALALVVGTALVTVAVMRWLHPAPSPAAPPAGETRGASPAVPTPPVPPTPPPAPRAPRPPGGA